ncbi:nuclear transport factor 2 family protein [Herbiconiux daphne]|uniref:Nuclear transport factor 2 family protein n=1 Tax=Herbiconiux daphne TaxID=2970914 RepID=A0ABT2H5B0_9MICO|nr:nuclear transport factor 2 family protein [Herbiconiux daphne]MCS5735083.1 nuclear transport factor 2 family protein [Herbiconiux daphne]
MTNTEAAEIADAAYAALIHGLNTGQWDPFLYFLAEEVDVVWPTPPMAGHFEGREGSATLKEIVSHLGRPETYRLDHFTPIARIVSGDDVIYEDISVGTVQGGSTYTTRGSVRLSIRDGKIAAFHEYNFAVS